MSFCRWSSDGFQCDVYCYEDVGGGFTTHIAARRRRHKVIELDMSNKEAFEESYKKRNEQLNDEINNPLLEIGLPHDGETFNDPSLDAMLERLTYLKSLGYVVPDRVIKNIQEEIAETTTGVGG